MSLRFFTISLMVLICACTPPKPESRVQMQIKTNSVVIDPQSYFAKHLEVLSLGTYESRQVQFQSVGKMIAVSNASHDLRGARTIWAELDPSVTRAAQLKLSPENEGVAYGVTSVSAELIKQISLGQGLFLKHYHVVEAGWKASIYKLIPTQDSSTVDIVFRVPDGRDLYPGTNCEVMFPLLHAQAIRVPATSLVHQGIDEFVWQEIAANEYRPQRVTPVEGSPDEVILSSGISEKSRIVGRGAILLKPLIKSILANAAGASHVE